MPVLTWLKKRSIESNTWLNVGLLLTILAFTFPVWAIFFMLGAVSSASIGGILQEKSNRY